MNSKQSSTPICRTCLSSGREMIPLRNIEHLILIANLDLGPIGYVCWECHSFLRKYFVFKNQVRVAKECFSNYIKTGSLPKSLSNLSCNKKLTLDVQCKYGDPLFDENHGTEHSDFTKNIKKEKDTASDIRTDDSKVATSSNFTYVMKPDFDAFVAAHNVTPSYLPVKIELNNGQEILNEAATDDQVESKYICVTLNEEETLRHRERKRNEPNYKKMPYKCDKCVLAFKRKDTFDAHVVTRHDEAIGSFSCVVCEIRFSNASEAQKHQNSHYSYYECKICKHETRLLTSMVTHCKTMHKGDSVDRVHCPICSDVFKAKKKRCKIRRVARTAQKSDGELRSHRRSAHALSCELCPQTFTNRTNLRHHKQRIHLAKREFTCEVCQKQLANKSRWESHLYGHGGERAKELAYCKICDVQFKTLYIYRNHLLTTTVHPNDTYECPACHKRFASRFYKKQHYEIYHLKKSKYKCEECDKIFPSHSKLKAHRVIKHGGVRTRDHACADCGKTFYTAKILQVHKLTHSSVRGFMCSECGDTFKQASALYLHIRLVHKGLKRPTKPKEK